MATENTKSETKDLIPIVADNRNLSLIGFGKIKVFKTNLNISTKINGYNLESNRIYNFFSPSSNSFLNFQISVENIVQEHESLDDTIQTRSSKKLEKLVENRIKNIDFLNLAIDSPEYEYHYKYIRENNVIAYVELTTHEIQASLLTVFGTLKVEPNREIPTSTLKTSQTKDQNVIDLAKTTNFAFKTFNKMHQNIFAESPKLETTNNVLHFGSQEDDFVQKILEDSLTNHLKKVIIIGSKNIGKSSLNRYLINNLLNFHNAIYYLDLDPGQTEFTPPSILGLTKIEKPIFSQPFCHRNSEENGFKVLKYGYLGELSPESYREEYLDISENLFAAYNEILDEIRKKSSFQDITSLNPPLIINSMGWIDGLGLKFISDITRIVAPSDILHIVSPDNEPITFEILNSKRSLRNQGQFNYNPEPINQNVEFSYIFRQNNTGSESRNDKNCLKAINYREMMLSSCIIYNCVKLVQILVHNICISVFNTSVLKELYLNVVDKNLVGIFSELPENSETCFANSEFLGLSMENAPIQYKTSKYSPKLSKNCLGIAFIKNIKINDERDCEMTLIVDSHILSEDIKHIVKGNRGLDLNVEQMRYLNSNSNDFIENFNREDMVKGSDSFRKNFYVKCNGPKFTKNSKKP